VNGSSYSFTFPAALKKGLYVKAYLGLSLLQDMSVRPISCWLCKVAALINLVLVAYIIRSAVILGELLADAPQMHMIRRLWRCSYGVKAGSALLNTAHNQQGKR
jgi:hypothetical protein